MWEASKTVVNPNGTITVTKLTGMAILGAAGATIILFSSDAWNNVTFAGEIKDPKKNIPRSLFLGTLIVTIVYIFANVAYLALLPMHGNPLQEMLSVTESCSQVMIE
jgi:APA family basic amino acid/polyamine antiporter